MSFSARPPNREQSSQLRNTRKRLENFDEGREREIDLIFNMLPSYRVPYGQRPRSLLFIDGTNTFMAAKTLGLDVSYGDIWHMLNDRSHLIGAYYFTGMPDSGEINPVKPLVDFLDYHQYNAITKTVKVYQQEDVMGADGRPIRQPPRTKGNMDVEIAVHFMELLYSAQFDHFFLFSGDGDFRILLEAAQRKGVRCTVVSTSKTKPGFVADALRRQTNFEIELGDLGPYIMRENRRSNYVRNIDPSPSEES